MKKILAITIVAVMAIALCVSANAASLVNHSFDTIYVNDLENPAVNNGQAKAWSEENPIDTEITALRVRGWAHVDESTIEAFGYKVDDAATVFSADYIFQRDDVQAAFGVSADVANGFDITIDFANAGKGAHTITIFVKTADGSEIEVTSFQATQQLGGGDAAPVEASADQWLCGGEPDASKTPNWWFNPLCNAEDDTEGRNITVNFKAAGSFSGISAFCYCNAAELGAASTKVELIKDGATVATGEIVSEGDKDYVVDFGKTFAAGTYALKFTPLTGSNEANGTWFVLGGCSGTGEDVSVEANVNTSNDALQPAIMLVGAAGGSSKPSQPSNPATADASVIAIAAVAVVALAGVVVAKKVR